MLNVSKMIIVILSALLGLAIEIFLTISVKFPLYKSLIVAVIFAAIIAIFFKFFKYYKPILDLLKILDYRESDHKNTVRSYQVSILVFIIALIAFSSPTIVFHIDKAIKKPLEPTEQLLLDHYFDLVQKFHFEHERSVKDINNAIPAIKWLKEVYPRESLAALTNLSNSENDINEQITQLLDLLREALDKKRKLIEDDEFEEYCFVGATLSYLSHKKHKASLFLKLYYADDSFSNDYVTLLDYGQELFDSEMLEQAVTHFENYIKEIKDNNSLANVHVYLARIKTDIGINKLLTAMKEHSNEDQMRAGLVYFQEAENHLFDAEAQSDEPQILAKVYGNLGYLITNGEKTKKMMMND